MDIGGAGRSKKKKPVDPFLRVLADEPKNRSLPQHSTGFDDHGPPAEAKPKASPGSILPSMNLGDAPALDVLRTLIQLPTAEEFSARILARRPRGSVDPDGNAFLSYPEWSRLRSLFGQERSIQEIWNSLYHFDPSTLDFGLFSCLLDPQGPVTLEQVFLAIQRKALAKGPSQGETPLRAERNRLLGDPEGSESELLLNLMRDVHREPTAKAAFLLESALPEFGPLAVPSLLRVIKESANAGYSVPLANLVASLGVFGQPALPVLFHSVQKEKAEPNAGHHFLGAVLATGGHRLVPDDWALPQIEALLDNPETGRLGALLAAARGDQAKQLLPKLIRLNEADRKKPAQMTASFLALKALSPHLRPDQLRTLVQEEKDLHRAMQLIAGASPLPGESADAVRQVMKERFGTDLSLLRVRESPGIGAVYLLREEGSGEAVSWLRVPVNDKDHLESGSSASVAEEAISILGRHIQERSLHADAALGFLVKWASPDQLGSAADHSVQRLCAGAPMDIIDRDLLQLAPKEKITEEIINLLLGQIQARSAGAEHALLALLAVAPMPKRIEALRLALVHSADGEALHEAAFYYISRNSLAVLLESALRAVMDRGGPGRPRVAQLLANRSRQLPQLVKKAWDIQAVQQLIAAAGPIPPEVWVSIRQEIDRRFGIVQKQEQGTWVMYLLQEADAGNGVNWLRVPIPEEPSAEEGHPLPAEAISILTRHVKERSRHVYTAFNFLMRRPDKTLLSDLVNHTIQRIRGEPLMDDVDVMHLSLAARHQITVPEDVVSTMLKRLQANSADAIFALEALLIAAPKKMHLKILESADQHLMEDFAVTCIAKRGLGAHFENALRFLAERDGPESFGASALGRLGLGRG